MVFDEDGSYIGNKKTLEKTEIVKDRGTYAVVVWVKKGGGKSANKEKEKGKGGDSMDIAGLQGFSWKDSEGM